LLIALLTYLGPLLRSAERYRWWARGLSEGEPADGGPGHARLPLSWRDRAFSLSFWTESGLEKEAILDGLKAEVRARKYFVVVDDGWSAWDLEVQGGVWSRARVTVATEYHGGERRVLRVRTALRFSLLTRVAVTLSLLAGAAGLGMGQGLLIAAGGVGALSAALAFAREALGVGKMLDAALRAVAARVHLHDAPSLGAREGHPA
jgi:hypothetical protein